MQQCREVQAALAVQSTAYLSAQWLDSKLGLIIPKKKAKLSVERNAIKRVAREAFLAFTRKNLNNNSIHAICHLTESVKEFNIENLKNSIRIQIDQALEESLNKAILKTISPTKK